MVVLELLKAFVTKIKKKNNMKKGHYGKYTGNARHSRKEEMIHDREMIYDAKTQIHNEDRKYKESGSSSDKRDMIHERELIHDTKSQLHRADQDYKNDSPLHYKPGDIHSGSTGAYDAGSNEFSAQVAEVKGIGDINKAYGEAASEIITALGEKPDQKEKPDMTMTKEYLNKRGGIGAANNPSLDPATYGPNGTPGGGNKAFDPNTYSNLTITPTNFDELPTLSGGSTGGGDRVYTDDMAFKNMTPQQKQEYGNDINVFKGEADEWRKNNPDMDNFATNLDTRDTKKSSPWSGSSNFIIKGLMGKK